MVSANGTPERRGLGAFPACPRWRHCPRHTRRDRRRGHPQESRAAGLASAPTPGRRLGSLFRIGGFDLLNLGLWIVLPATVIGALHWRHRVRRGGDRGHRSHRGDGQVLYDQRLTTAPGSAPSAPPSRMMRRALGDPGGRLSYSKRRYTFRRYERVHRQRQGEGRVPVGGDPGIDVRFVVFALAAEARTWNGPLGILSRAIAVTGGAVYVATATRASHRGLPLAGTWGCR